jgi:hypothetical protein
MSATLATESLVATGTAAVVDVAESALAEREAASARPHAAAVAI